MNLNNLNYVIKNETPTHSVDTGQHSSYTSCLKSLSHGNEPITNPHLRYHLNQNDNYDQNFYSNFYPQYQNHPKHYYDYLYPNQCQLYNGNYAHFPPNRHPSSNLFDNHYYGYNGSALSINNHGDVNNNYYNYNYNPQNIQATQAHHDDTIQKDQKDEDEIPEEILAIIDDLQTKYPSFDEHVLSSSSLTRTISDEVIDQKLKVEPDFAVTTNTDFHEMDYDFENDQSLVNCHLQVNQDLVTIEYTSPSKLEATLNVQDVKTCEINGPKDQESKKLPIFACNYPGCGKSYNSRRSLNIHIQSHTRQKPFLCKLCARRFGQEHQFRKHMQLIHFLTVPSNLKSLNRLTERRKFICKFPGCNRFFYRFLNLKIHDETHLIENQSGTELNLTQS